MAATGSRLQTEVPSKSTLFCPNCDHHSPVDGDWKTRETARLRRIHCPACHTTVATRPRRTEDRVVGARPGP